MNLSKRLLSMAVISSVLVMLLANLWLPVSAQDTATYQDPTGRYTVPIPTNWAAETITHPNGDIALLQDPDKLIHVYIVVVPNKDLPKAIAEAWQQAKPDFTFTSQQTQELPSSDGFDKTLIMTQLASDQKTVYQAFAQLAGEDAYIMLFDADVVAAQKRSAQLQIIATGLKVKSVTSVNLKGVQAKTLGVATLQALDQYIELLLKQSGLPGMAVAIVQDGKVIYSKGFGVRELGSSVPIDADTLMMIGSTTKALTTMAMGSVVDAGKMQWDDPVIKYLPTFKMADPELTKRITIRNLVCACTGVPRRDLQTFFSDADQTAEQLIESLSTFQVFTKFGEAFQYSNQMVATGGYATAAADGGDYGQLYQAYVDMMQRRIFRPIGMDKTTFSLDAVKATDDYAMPHQITLDAAHRYSAFPVEQEGTFLADAPAGTLWSTANDMANYLITQLNVGVSPDGTRVVSEANLRETWKPQVAVDANTQYGLGWMITSYKGIPMITHGGNTLGFSAEVTFLPDNGLGVLALSNAQGANVYLQAVIMRVLEQAFAQPQEFDATLAFATKQVESTLNEVVKQLKLFTTEEVTPYLGTFKADALGTMVIALEDGKLMLHTRYYNSELRKAVSPKNEVRFITLETPLFGLPFEFTKDATGQPTITLDLGTDKYIFVKQP